MKDQKPNATSRVRVRHLLKDAETVMRSFESMTTPYQNAAASMKAIIEEILPEVDMDVRVGETSFFVRARFSDLVAIMDGDFSRDSPDRVLPSQGVLEPIALYDPALGETKQQRTIEAPDPLVNELPNKKTRNPPWTRAEIILATEVYLLNDGRVLGPNDQPVIELSQYLNRLPIIPLDARNEKFRNPEGVGLKLSNIRAADPDRPGGSPHGNKLDGVFWSDFSGDEHLLFAEARKIRARYAK